MILIFEDKEVRRIVHLVASSSINSCSRVRAAAKFSQYSNTTTHLFKQRRFTLSWADPAIERLPGNRLLPAVDSTCAGEELYTRIIHIARYTSFASRLSSLSFAYELLQAHESYRTCFKVSSPRAKTVSVSLWSRYEAASSESLAFVRPLCLAD